LLQELKDDQSHHNQISTQPAQLNRITTKQLLFLQF